MSGPSAIADLLQAVELGLDFQAFMASKIGKALARRANEEIEAADFALRTVDPDNPKAIRALQFKAAVASAALTWIGEIVTQGENAEMQLQSMDDIQPGA